MENKLNGFNNGRDTSEGIGGREPVKWGFTGTPEEYNTLTKSKKEKFLLENGWYREQWNRNFFTNDKLREQNESFDEDTAYVFLLEEKLNLTHA